MSTTTTLEKVMSVNGSRNILTDREVKMMTTNKEKKKKKKTDNKIFLVLFSLPTE